MLRLWNFISELPQRRWASLWLNHVDAWSIALIVAALALFVQGALSRETLPLLLALGAGYWFAFALNDYFDAPYDALAPGKARGNFFIASTGHTLTAKRSGLVVLLAAAFAVGALLVWGFAPFGRRGWLVLIVGLG